MKNQIVPRRARILVAIGLLLVVTPMLLREYVPIADFLRGFIQGMGIAFELTGAILIVRARKAKTSC